MEQIKEGFKKTEVGVIPEDWDLVTLKEISEKIMVGIASAATHAYQDNGVVLLRNQNIKGGYLDDSDILFINENYESKFKNKRLKYGDLLTARTGYPGATCLIPKKYENAQSFTTLITRLIKEKTYPDYINFFINSEKGQDFFDTNQIGGGQKNVNAGTLKNLQIPLPPTLEEQKAIATALSDVDALIQSLDKLIAKKKAIKQGSMQRLLKSPAEGGQRLPGFSGEWDTKKLGEVIDLLTGFPFPSNKYSSSGIKLLRGSNIKRGITDWGDDIIQYWPSISPDIKKFELKAGDIVVAMDGSLVGRSFAQLSEEDLPALLLQRVARIRSSEVDTNYLKECVCSENFTKHCDSVKTVTAIPHISPKDIRTFTINIPPSKEEQKAIAEILSDMDKEIENLEQKREKYKSIKQGMMQELLTGKKRLV